MLESLSNAMTTARNVDPPHRPYEVRMLIRTPLTAQLLRGTLVGAFTSWRRTAIQFRRLRGILTRVMSRALSTAWEAWRDAVAERHERMQSLAVFVGHWRNLHLSAAFNAWVAHVHKRAAARRLCLRVLGRLLEWAWYGWREAVFEAGVSRGADVHEARLLARSWRGWRWATSEGRKAAALTAALNQAAALTAMGVWRRQWLARAAYRRLYCRRALLGWHSRTQELRAMRERLWYAARFLLNGCLLRSFSAWWQYTQVRPVGSTWLLSTLQTPRKAFTLRQAPC